MNHSPMSSTRSAPRLVNSGNTDVDWAGWALFGLVATSVLTAVMIAAQLAGLTRLDLPLLLGTVATEDPDRARVAGFFIHLTIGKRLRIGVRRRLRVARSGHVVARWSIWSAARGNSPYRVGAAPGRSASPYSV